MDVENIKEKIKDSGKGFREEYGLVVLTAFVASTALMLYQHSLGWSWDFSTYSMIGSYILHDGFYMEWLRPPIASTIMGLLQFIFSVRASEYVFIALTSGFFLYSSKRLAKNYELNHEAFYILLLTPAALFFSTINGAEMLSLAFVMMFLADFQKPHTGIWLGLTFLTRYNFGLIIPLVLAQKDIKKIVKTGVISGITLVPWLAYNFIQTGNPLTSFGNFLMLNVFLRYANTPLDPQNLLIMTLPTSLLLLAYYRPDLRKRLSLSTKDILMLGFTLLIGLSYLTADYRSLRYLYPMILPAAFYGAEAWEVVGSRNLLRAFLALNLVAGGAWISISELTDPRQYNIAADSMDNCMAESEAWVPMNYAGVSTKPVSDENITFKRLEEGYRSVSFKNPEYRNLSAPVITNNERFTVYGYEEKCAEVVKADDTYLEGFNKRSGLNYTFRDYVYNRFIQEKVKGLR